MTHTKKLYLARKRDVFFLTLVLGAFLSAAGYIYYRYEESKIRSEKHTELKAIAELKTNQIINWYKDELEDAGIISRNPILLPDIKKWLINKNNLIKSNILGNFSELKVEHNYENILLADLNGELLLSLDTSYTKMDSTISKCIMQSINKKSVFAIDLFKEQLNKKIQLGFVSPLLNNNKEPIAVLVLIIDPSKYLYPLIQTWPTTSKTAETIIVRKEGDNVLFLNELRHIKNTALQLRINLTKVEIPAVKAARGYEDIFEGVDYRGVSVLSDLQVISGTPWFMVAKVDQSEIYSELNYRTSVIIVFILLLIMLFGSGLALAYNYRQRNIYMELYKKEKELWESQEEFKTTLYSIGDGVITTDINGYIKQMNHEAERLTGWSETEAKGKYLEEVFVIINEITRIAAVNPVNKVLKEGKIIGLANHTVLISKDSKEIPIADSGAPIKNEDGIVIGVVLVFKDQTREYAIQKALEESEERLRLALETANQGIIDINIKTGETRLTPDYARMLGHDPKEFLENESAWLERIHPEDKDRVRNQYLDYINGKLTEFRVEFRRRVKSGDWKWILAIGKIVKVDEKGNPLRMLGTDIDISEYKRLQSELILAKDRAENSVKLKSEFLAQMSHEIRSPINVILSYIDLIKNDLSQKIDSELLPAFDSISLAGNRIIRTIDLILNMSELQLGIYEINYKKFDISVVLKSLVREYLQPAAKKNNNISIDILSNDCNLISDEYAVNQIFANLIDNAVKYTDNGVISITVNKKNNKLIIQVCDTGVGISEEYIPVLFTPFSQEEQGYTRRFDGNGLGLSIVKRYCNLLDAEIDVTSKKNVGTTFTVTFPVAN